MKGPLENLIAQKSLIERGRAIPKGQAIPNTPPFYDKY